MGNKKYNLEEKKEAKKLAQKKWRDNNKEKIKTYLEINKEQFQEKSKKYRENNKEKICKYNKEYREDNKEKIKNHLKINEDKIKEREKKYRENNKEKICKYNKEYKQNTLNKNKIKLYMKTYRKINHDKILEQQKQYIRERKKIDVLFRLSTRVRALICNSFTRNGHKKNSQTQDILGCTFDQLKQHLESKFELWMNWDNRGLYNSTYNYGWDIDHKTPLATAKTEEDIIRLNHYTNLQPLCSKINREIKKDN
jgi:hypothetical protein